ncbi:MAG: hypothetical protein H7249_02960 [Chitinophagaceae bacterium]|nr:hypothetical protein [Oligoflexus sp.]
MMIIKKFSKMLGLCSLIFLGSSACNVKEKLPPLGKQISGAVDIVTSPSGKLFYVLNSDYERRYNTGSLIVIDPAAPAGSEKINAIGTPRVGRSLHVQGNLLLITYADSEARALGTVEMWDTTDERTPSKMWSRNVDCNPLNGIISPDLTYFAIGCIGGNIYVGKNPRSAANVPTTFDLVRSYGYDHHALYFYSTGGKTFLLGFPSDIDKKGFADATVDDKQSYIAATDTVVDGPNGVPDTFELTAAERRQTNLAHPYQMFVYPVTDEEEASKAPHDPAFPVYGTFRYILHGSFTKPSVSDTEIHYIYYNLLEADGQAPAGNGIPDSGEYIITPNKHRYRTNFWEIKNGVENNPAIFYISQRGDYNSQSNNVLRVVINDAALLNAKTSNFEQMFQVNRVYGFKIDHDNGGRYPGAFDIANIDGEPMLLVNSFRDLIYYAEAPFYSITRKLLDNPTALTEVPSSFDSTDFRTSFYQIAVATDPSVKGKMLTSSFYGNILYLFDASPNVSIRGQKPIEIK